MRDEDVRRELERLSLPPEDPEFFDRLRSGLRERDRTSVRRWRAATVTLAAVAAAAVAAAAVATARGGGAVLDRTLSCKPAGDVPGVTFDAWPESPSSARAGVQIGSGAGLVRFESGVAGFVLDGARCRATGADVPFSRGSLSSVSALSIGYTPFRARCFPAGRLLVRVRLALDGEGRPRRAVVALRAAADGRPLALVRWQPDLVQARTGADCPSG